MRRSPAVALALLVTLACDEDRGFRFHAEYGAPRSGYRIKLISQGWVKSAADISENAYELVQFCPVSAPDEAGYRTLDSAEVIRTLRVIQSALLGDKGVVLEGQIDSLDVVSTKTDYGFPIVKDRPPETWIKPSELPGCTSVARALTSARRQRSPMSHGGTV
jgi:hypothetical protein